MRIAHLDTAERVVVVAEIGNNHEGDVSVARTLVREAAAAGADAVKFQTFRTEHFVSAADEARFQRLKGFELTFDQFAELAELARSLGLAFLSTPLDLASADFLGRVADAVKVASGDNDFYPLLRQLARTRRPLVVSLGLADEDQVVRTVACVEEAWRDIGAHGELALLHCVSAYPVPPVEASLRTIQRLRERWPHTIGYSDHTVGTDAALLAVALGARIVEKHFTLDKQYSSFRDHSLSADPPDLADLVRRIRLAEQMLGQGDPGRQLDSKRVQPTEAAAAGVIRRSIVAGRDLEAGHRLGWEDLTWIRPAGGLTPGQEPLLLGRTLRRPVLFGEPLGVADVE